MPPSHFFRSPIPRAVLSIGLFLAALLMVVPTSWAESNGTIAEKLGSQDVYITNHALPGGHLGPGDLGRLQREVNSAASQGVAEKIGILAHYSSHAHSPVQAAHLLRDFINFSGVLILVTPQGIGISSDALSSSELTSIAHQVAPLCLRSYADCAIAAGQKAAARVKTDNNNQFRSAAIFWVVILGLFGLLILAVVLFNRRRARSAKIRTDDFRAAAESTLAQADSAVTEIESSHATIPADVRGDYDRALGLRDRARVELQRATSSPMLTQANEDAAQAVLALQGVMRKLGMQTALTGSVDLPVHRCFYCAHEDRPPYVTRTIDDGKGNTMDVEICSVCRSQLEAGQTPQMATVQYGGAAVPWWAVPANPWYYAYGGPSWQYWLPFMIGIDVGGWFGGGWGGFSGADPYAYGGGWGGDPGYGGDYVGTPSDAGGGSFNDWGTDSGNSGSDSGGADFGGWGDGGGDFGGDSGGADFGGGDSGGWG